MNYPTLTAVPNRDFGDDTNKMTIKSESQGGYTTTRARNSRSRETFNVKYTDMSETDHATLKAFFDDDAGGASEIFNWTHPTSSTVYEVRFKEDKLARNFLLEDTWTVEFVLEEA